MRAMVYERYGPPSRLRLAEVPEPEVGPGQVLIRVHAASVNRSDLETLIGRPAYIRISGSGLLRPRRQILGSDVAGTVEAVGPEVTQFRPGDEVLGDLLYGGGSTFAEYVAVKETALLVAKPPAMSFSDAAAIPQAALLALLGLRHRGEVKTGDRVLINGAGGGGGTFAIQLAKAAGAEVVAVDNTHKLDLMRDLGADRVVDHTTQDVTSAGERFDRILDFAGNRSVLAYLRILEKGGVYAVVGASVPKLLTAATVGPILLRQGGRSMGLLIAQPNRDDLAHVAGLVAAGELHPAVDSVYPLAELPAALQRMADGTVLGKVVIDLTT